MAWLVSWIMRSAVTTLGVFGVFKRADEVRVVRQCDAERDVRILYDRVIRPRHVGAQGDRAALCDLDRELIAGPVEADEPARPEMRSAFFGRVQANRANG